MRLKKQQRFLKFKGKDIVCYKLKTLNKLKEAKEKEKQIKFNYIAFKAAIRLFDVLVLLLTKINPFAKINILLLLPRV